MNRNSGSPGLTDLVDLDILQRLQDDFAAATGVSATIMDLKAKPITRPSNTHRLCRRIIRRTEEGNHRCMQSDRKCGRQAARTRSPAIHTCHAGLTDFAVPLEVDGRLIAYMFGGQVLPGKPNPVAYRRKAEELGRELGFDPEEYLEALEEIPILPMDRIEAAARLMHTVANTISDMANQRIKAAQRADDWASSLQAIGVGITSAILDLEEVLPLVVKGATRVTGADAATLYVYDHSTDKFSLPVGVGLLDPARFEQSRPKGDGVAAKIVKERKPIIASDVGQHPHFSDLEILKREEVVSSAGFPLIARENAVGVLFIDFRTYHSFTLEERENISTFADQAAAAIDNARLFEKTKRNLRRLEVLQEIKSHIDSAYNLEDILQVILKEGLAAVRTDEGSVMLVNRETDKLNIRAWLVEGKFVPGKEHLSLDIGKGIAGYVVISGEAYNCANTALDEHFESSFGGRDIGSLVSVPIRSHGRVIGVINADHPERNFFTDDDVRLLSALSDHAAVAIESYRLRDLGMALSSAVNREAVAELVVEHMVELISCDACTIYDLDTDTGMLTPMASRGEYAEETLAFPIEVGTGITGSMAKKGVGEILNRADRDPRAVQMPGVPDDIPVSLLVEPLKVKGEVTGAVRLERLGHKKFYENDHRLLSTIATQIALALENARLFEEAQQRAFEAETLAQSGKAISSTLNLNETLASIVESACRLTGTEKSTILLLDEQTDNFTRGARYPFGKSDAPRRSGGLTRLIVDTGQPVIIPDTSQDSRVRQSVLDEGVLSVMGVPVQIEDSTIGALFVNSTQQRRFTAHHVDLLLSLASQAAVAIENARLFQDTNRRAQELASLHDVTLSIVSDLKPRLVLEKITQNALSVLDADVVTLYQYFQERDEFVVPPVIAGEVRHPVAMHTRIHRDDVVARIVKAGESHYAADAEEDEVLLGPSGRMVPARDGQPERLRFVLREGVKSSAGVLLKVAGEVVGVMFVNYRKPRRFTEDEKRLIETFSNQAAIAIRNARLFEQVRSDRDRRLAELNALIAIDEVITTQDLDTVLDRILEAALTIVGAPNGNILLVDESGDHIELRSIRGAARAEGAPTRLKIGEHGVTGWVARHRTPARIPDVRADEWQGIYVEALPDTQSELAVPLLDEHGKLLGVINLESPQADAFSPDDERLLEALARQAVIAIRNAEQVEALQKSNAWLEAYSVIDKAIVESVQVGTNLDDVLQIILEKGMEITRSPCGNIMWYDEARGDLVMRAQKGVPPEEVEYRQRIGQGIVGLAAETRETVPVPDVTVPPWSDIYLPFIPGMRSELATPMVEGDRLLGVLNVEHPGVNAFSAESQERLEALARQAVIAIQNVTRYEDLQRRNADIKALQEVSRVITATLDVDEVLNLILDNALKLTGAEIGAIRLVDPTTQDLVARVSRIPEGVVIDEEWARVPIGRGITGWCVEQRRPVLVPNTEQEPKYISYFQGMRSEVAVPLLQGKEALGVVNLESPQVGAFNKHDVRLLSALADEAVIAIQNAERYQSVLDGQKKLQALREVDQAIVGTLDLDQVLKLILEKGLEITGAKWGDLTLFDADGREPVTYAVVEKGPRIEKIVEGMTPGWEVGLTKGIVKWVAREKQPYLSQGDVQKDSRYRGFPYIHAEVAVPLVGGDGALVGVLNLESEQVDHFVQDDVEILEAFAGQAVIAVQNARNYQETHKARERFEVLSDLGKRLINAPLDVKAILDIGLEEGLVRVKKAHAVGAWLWDENTETLHLQATLGVEEDGRVWEPIEPGEGVNGWVAVHRQTCRVPDVRYPPDGMTYRPGLERTQGEVVVPLVVGSTYFGNLDLAFPTVNAFDEDDVRLIEGLADQVAVALHRAEQYAELESIRRREMEAQWMASIGETAMEITHQLGNRLGLIKTWAEEIWDEIGRDNEVVNDRLERIARNIKNTLSLAARFKEDLVRDRDVPMTRKLIPPTAILHYAQKGCIVPANVKVDVDCPEDLAPIWGDERLFEAFTNLFTNAVQVLSPKGGRIMLRATEINGWIELTVADDGPGIRPDRLDKIFNLFYTTRLGGMGFGLWSAKRRILANGGDITVASTVGKGTIFTVRLPGRRTS